MGMLPSWRTAPTWKDADKKPNPEAIYDSCGEEIGKSKGKGGDGDGEESEDEVAMKERWNERKILMRERERERMERGEVECEEEENEYDSDSEVDEDEAAFNELMTNHLLSPTPSSRGIQTSAGIPREEIIIISDSEDED